LWKGVGQLLNFNRENALFLLKGLVVYRRILNDEVISTFVKSLQEDNGDTIFDFISLLIEKAHALGLSGNIFRQYLIYAFLNDENIFTLACENKQQMKDSSLYAYAMQDLSALQQLCELDVLALKDHKSILNLSEPFIEDLEKAATPKEKMSLLLNYYINHGAGDMPRFRMFSVNNDGALVGIHHPDAVEFKDIIGCDHQKTALIENIEAFLKRRPANNILLVGSRGNGKSSCIKALVNQYYNQGLRLVEIQKDQVVLLPKLVEKLAARGKFFIIHMDDLSFEQFETQYKYLKSLLEGGAGVRPDNVLFCATSNRRHIIRESWSDRDGGGTSSNDEVHVNDTINEKMSLSDRFGLTLHFPHINQEEYLKIVKGLATQRGINIDIEILCAKALQWSVEHKRMSGRTAVQFLDHIQ